MRIASRKMKIGFVLASTLLMSPLPVFGQSTPAAADSAVGTVSAIFGEGDLKVEATIGTKSQPKVRYIRKGAYVFERDAIETGPEQTAKILLQDDSEIVLAPLTRCLVETFVKRKGQGRGFEFSAALNLMYGTVRALVRHVYSENEAFAVKTSNATMGVRGTHFVVTFTAGSLTTELHVLKGAVAIGPAAIGAGIVSNPAATTVRAGMRTSVSGAGGPATKPAAFNGQSFRQQLKALSPHFERAVGDDATGASQSTGAPKSFSDALKAKHAGDRDRPGTDAGGSGSTGRNLRGNGTGSGSSSGIGGLNGGSASGAGSGVSQSTVPGGMMPPPPGGSLPAPPGGSLPPPPGGSLPPPPGGSLPPPPGGSLPPPPGGSLPPPPRH
ncbi:MAG: FecR domain-containing protein [Deltaproteobacteria bacterium]|nr:FecR domain-containing protein [Deltaproteobacteria bacterium]